MKETKITKWHPRSLVREYFNLSKKIFKWNDWERNAGYVNLWITSLMKRKVIFESIEDEFWFIWIFFHLRKKLSFIFLNCVKMTFLWNNRICLNLKGAETFNESFMVASKSLIYDRNGTLQTFKNEKPWWHGDNKRR